jgi:hypothetical protein
MRKKMKKNNYKANLINNIDKTKIKQIVKLNLLRHFIYQKLFYKQLKTTN